MAGAWSAETEAQYLRMRLSWLLEQGRLSARSGSGQALTGKAEARVDSR